MSLPSILSILYKWNHTAFVLLWWLISRNTMSSRFTHVVACLHMSRWGEVQDEQWLCLSWDGQRSQGSGGVGGVVPVRGTQAPERSWGGSRSYLSQHISHCNMHGHHCRACEMQTDSVGLGWNLKFHVSSKFSGDALLTVHQLLDKGGPTFFRLTGDLDLHM